MPRLFRIAPLGLVLLLAGCQGKLDIAKTYTMEPGDSQFLLVEAPAGEQKINVAVKSGGVPLNVYVVPGTTSAQAQQAVQENKRVLASKTKAADPTLDATVPAKQAYVIMLDGAEKPAKIEVKITSR